MHLHRTGRRRLGMRLSNEATLASITAISREVAPAALHPAAARPRLARGPRMSLPG
jgi:hypothetical protein